MQTSYGSELMLLDSLKTAVNDYRLKDGLSGIEEFITKYGYPEFQPLIDSINNDYQLMLIYHEKGMLDPQREDIYASLLKRAYILIADIYMKWKIDHNHDYMKMNARAGSLNMTVDGIREKLETYVSEVAMLSLMPDMQNSEELYEKHASLMEEIFDSIVISRCWTKEEAGKYIDLILSPTIDSHDAQLMISAIMLNLNEIFDPCKFIALMDIYQRSSDIYIKQRALIGWSFAMSGAEQCIFTEAKEKLNQLLDDDQTERELLDLQKQVYYTVDADKDNQKIQKDIIPDLINRSNFKMGKFGIEEIQEDPMKDILNPDSDDKAMAEVEEKIHQMHEMEKQGSDIYFGGFSQMKKFAFFYDVSHWFTPFYAEHPDLKKAREATGNSKFLEQLKENGPFCDSDKYSFGLAMSSVIAQMPANIREMIDSGALFGATGGDAFLNKMDPLMIRRWYLQDIYRFYRLYSNASQFYNPFEDDSMGGTTGKTSAFYMVKRFAFHPGFIKNTANLGKFLYTRHKEEDLDELLETRSLEDKNLLENEDWLLLSACKYMDICMYGEAIPRLEKLLEMNAGNEKAMKLLARAYFHYEEYEKAKNLYDRLNLMYPDNKSILLNYSISLMETGELEKGISHLYKLEYENPDNANVVRALAWAMLMQGEYEKAEQKYQNLIHGTETTFEDYLNAGYCSWFSGDIREAVKRFVHCHSLRSEFPMTQYFDRDSKILNSKHISKVDIQLMNDLVVNSSNL